MKKVFVLLVTLLIALTLVGCNVAPKVPIVTPYGSGYNNNGRGFGTNVTGGVNGAVNPENANLRNPSDKYALPGVVR